jgi:DNA polymerase III subunit gamma/tau
VKIGFLCQIVSCFFGAAGFVASHENRQAGVNAMASQSLYRKWRSQTFGELVGQEPVIRTLKNALSSGNLAHAYLFTGPRGTGKTSTARLLAKTINCSRSENGEPCNGCEQCREITAGNSFNVVEIDAASNRGIDSIRELREKVMMPPTTGKYKVYILDEAHMLTVEAFNALLKTLEEPPPHAIFVMATTDVHKMLPTVLSRCQRFDFKRITTRQIVDHLRFIATQEHVTLESGAAELIARAASGGMRDALSLLDQATAYAGSTIALTQVQAMLGVADPRAIQKFISAVADLDSPGGLHLIHELAEAGADLRQINGQVAEYWRAMMLAKAGANIAEILDHTDDEMREIVRMSQSFALEELTECAKIFAQNELVQRNQGTPQLGLELALLSCLELHRREKGGQVQARVSSAISQPSIHNVPDGYVPKQQSPIRQQVAAEHLKTEQQSPIQQRVAAEPLESEQQSPIRQQVAVEPLKIEKDAGSLPDWDGVSYPDEDEALEKGPITPSETLVHASSSTPLVNFVASVPPELSPLPDRTNLHVAAGLAPAAPISDEPLGDGGSQRGQGGQGQAAVPTVKEGEVAASPLLTLQEVKEKWEYIKRRVKSKKEGAKIAALLNGYAVVGIEQGHGIPVVVIRANAEFHYSTLQKTAHHETIDWALKVELERDCKVRMLPPGQGGASLGMTIPPPPVPLPTIDNMAGGATSVPQAILPPQSVHQEHGQTQVVPPPPKEEPQARSDQGRPVSSTAIDHDVSSQPSPLARTTDVRENTPRVSTSDSRLLFAQKRAKSDQVVQEVVRLFKAEVKDIQLK